MELPEQRRVLSLDITNKGVAFAVFTGTDALFEWGTRSVKDKAKNSYLARVEELYERYLPHLLVLEDPDGAKSKRGDRAKAIINRLELFALGKYLPVAKFSRGDVQVTFRGEAKTKQEIAEAIVTRFPELIDDLPDLRRAWEAETDRMNIFDAVSFALTAFRNPERLEEIEG